MEVVIWVVKNEFDEVLLVERKKKDWVPFSFPSWVVESWETKEEAVFREILEETWISSDLHACLWQRTHPSSGVHISYFYLSWSGTPVLTDPNIASVMWMHISQLLDVLWDDIFPPVLEKLSINGKDNKKCLLEE